MNKLSMVLISLLILLSACSPSSSEKYETIDLDHIESKVEEGYVVVDVREVDEFNGGHIIGAINHPLTALKNSDFTHLNPDQDYIIICQSGNRSKEASEILVGEGYHVLNVSEGMSTWKGEIE